MARITAEQISPCLGVAKSMSTTRPRTSSVGTPQVGKFLVFLRGQQHVTAHRRASGRCHLPVPPIGQGRRRHHSASTRGTGLLGPRITTQYTSPAQIVAITCRNTTTRSTLVRRSADISRPSDISLFFSASVFFASFFCSGRSRARSL